MSAQLLSIFILVVSGLLLVFWLRIACRSILRQQFERDYTSEVVSANRLEFLAVRKTLEESREMADCASALSSLQRDYEALTYLLRNAATVHVGKYSRKERFLVLDFHLLRLWIWLKRVLGAENWREELLEMTDILQYFANVMGQRLVTFPATVRRS